MSTIDIRRAAQYATVAENAAAQCVIVADNLQANVEELTGQATGAAQQALSSQAAAKASETASKSSETSASASAASAAQSAAESASSAAATGYVAPPFPDVWAPLSDDLKMISGYPVNTKLLSFTRASTATYIDKSGVLQTAAINEARFEKDGLLIEGASTNLYLNSDNPANWATSGVTKTQQADGSTQAVTGVLTVTADISELNMIANSTSVSLAVGGTVSISCRTKATNGRLRVRVANGAGFITDCTLDYISGTVTPFTGMTVNKSILDSDGYYTFSCTFTASTADSYFFQLRALPRTGQTVVPAGTEIRLQMPQLETGPLSTSYIPTAASTVTRADDLPSLTTLNGGFDNVTIACTVTRLWQSTSPPNTAPRIFSTRGNVAGSAWDTAFNTTGAVNSFGGQTNAGALVPGFIDGQVFTSVKTPTGLTTITPSGKTSGTQTTSPGFVSPLYVGNTKEINRPLFGHIRNLRIWHSALSDIQIKGLR
ncbi:phage head spike fiber domain-containing protein [Atlantibacter hermannii]|uniref:phage head spike fiber domain-containing protein n=1 Tax=Atlantibacter hermannii TaxID=565 RepID=UPI00289EC21F|nr:hypothetical protein [Atlantibacter hermannii]